MKKITFILFALIAGTVFGQTQKSITTTASAEVVSAIVFTETQDMNFGMLSVNSSAGGAITLAADATSTRTSTDGEIIEQSTPTNAQYQITGQSGYKFTVQLPTIDDTNAITLNGPAGVGVSTMTITHFTKNLSDATVATGSAQDLYVGAQLNYSANQNVGAYTGTFPVTVAYD